MSNLEGYRNYLRMLASIQCASWMQGKLDASGVIQQTMLDALKVSDEWTAWDESRQLSWLRSALSNNLKDEIRKLMTAGRDVGKEFSLDHAMHESNSRIESWLVAEQSSPSQRANRNEDLIRLADALAELPHDQGRVIELHHLSGLSITATAEVLGKSKEAIGGLLFRGMRTLRSLMESKSHGTG